MQDLRKTAAEIGGQREEPQGGRDWGVEQCGGQVELMKSAYYPVHHVHSTHTFRDTRGRSSQE